MAELAGAAIHSVQSGALCWAGHAALAASKPHHGQQVEEDNGGSGEPWPIRLPALGIPPPWTPESPPEEGCKKKSFVQRFEDVLQGIF